MSCDLLVTLCSCKNNTCFIAITVKQFWIWVPKPSSNILLDVASSILSFQLEWYDDFFLVSYKTTNISSWPQFKNQDSKLLDHAHCTFILEKWFESDTPLWFNIYWCSSFLFVIISKNNNNRTEWKEILSHINSSRNGRAARITLTIVKTQSGSDTGVNIECHCNTVGMWSHYNPYFCNSSDCHWRFRSGK